MIYHFNNINPLPPTEWIYKYYLDLKQNLDGRVIRLYSPFNNEKTPSAFLYYTKGKYKWKDHSSGKSGDAIDLAQALFEQSLGYSLNYSDVVELIKDDYKVWKKKNGKHFTPSTVKTEHYLYDLVCRFNVRPFNNADLQYWKQFGVDQKLLESYKVKPLENFQLGKRSNYDGINATVMKWMNKLQFEYSYGYFQALYDLIQIYNPEQEDLRHVTVRKSLFGKEQLNPYVNKTLIIASSMKDLLCIKSMDLKVDVVAPMGEKVIIDKEVISDFKNIYMNILTLFDNDRTGIKAMQMYKSLYDIDFVYFPYKKDISDTRKILGESFTRNHLVPAITKKFKPSIK